MDVAEPVGAAAGAPEPRANPDLAAHQAAERMLLDAYSTGKLPHALIIGGPRGIGKATLAFRLARFLLSQGTEGGDLFGGPPASLAVAPDHPVFRRVASGGHADLLTVARGRDPKTKKLRGEIVVADTREVASFLRLTSAEGGWRIVIVDAADDLNRNAANALLKILEEPPNRALLMLISHSPGRLLPTIRSRCRKLLLPPLAEATVLDLIARYRPGTGPEEAAALAGLAEGSIGRALDLAESGGIALYRDLFQLLSPLPALDVVALHSFADRLARVEAEAAFRTVADLLGQWLARMIRGAADAGNEAGFEIVPGEREAMRRLAARRSLDQWVEVWEKIARLFAQADGLNLDRKQVVLGAFFALEGAAS